MSDNPEVPAEQDDQEYVDTVEQPKKDIETEESAKNASSEEDSQTQLAEAVEKAEKHWELYLRAQAELENARRRAEIDIENAHKFGLEKFAMELLGVKDSLELGLGAEDADVDKLKEGTALTLKMLTLAMEKFHIQEIDPTGQVFDPNLHQAMTTQESSEHAPNTVISVMQKGYVLNDRLLRPAMVIVAKAAS